MFNDKRFKFRMRTDFLVFRFQYSIPVWIYF